MKDSDNNIVSKSRLKAYLTDQGSPDENEKWENVLLDDEEAFSLYMEALDELQDELPELMEQNAFIDRVMEEVVSKSVIKEPQKTGRSRWYDRTILHYVIAASLTLLFMSSGVFDRLMSGNMDVVVQQDSGGPSYSEKVMQATSGWLEQFMTDGSK